MEAISNESIEKVKIVHQNLLSNGKIDNIEQVFDGINDFTNEEKAYYLNYLLEYYFKKNDLENLQQVFGIGAKFDMKFSDVSKAFLQINSNEENVISFMEETIVFIKDNYIDEPLQDMYDYYMGNKELQEYLQEAVDILKANRYVCVHCFKFDMAPYSKLFLDEELLENIKIDMPYLLD